MKREDLQKIEGLTDDQINAIMNLHSDDVNSWTSRLNNVNAELKTERGKVTTLTADLEKYKDVDLEGLQNAKATYDTEKAKLIAEHEKEINDLKFNSALELKIRDTQTVDPIALKAHLDMSQLKYNDETKGLDGLDEQVKAIREAHGYLFEGTATGGSHGNLGGKNTGTSLSGALTEYYK